MPRFIHERPNWPDFTWDDEVLLKRLGSVRHLQGRIIGKMESLGFELRNEASLETLTLDILKTSEIEGELLDPEQVRSSIARRLGLDVAGMVISDRAIGGVVALLLNATQKYNEPLSIDRLYAWHSSLFPSGRSGLYKIKVGAWRDDSNGPMQVVSGAMGREKMHFEAASVLLVEAEMNRFVKWINNEIDLDPVIKAGIAHLWFVTIHPFEDGNGRIARALTDMLLSRGDKINQRFYSMSAQIRIERKQYYNILESSQKGNLDITDWLKWFLTCLLNALISAETILFKVLKKHEFWLSISELAINERQNKVLNRLLDGFEGKLTTVKWSRITKSSRDTALRDIQDLIEKGVLKKDEAGGRSSNYILLMKDL